MKDISRRSFIKGALAGTASIAAFGLTNGHAFAEESVYTPGTYSATADGMGKVKVTMTFSETAITDVVLDVSNETPSIGGAAETEAALRVAFRKCLHSRKMDGGREVDKEFGYIHPCTTFPLSDVVVEFPGQYQHM